MTDYVALSALPQDGKVYVYDGASNTFAEMPSADQSIARQLARTMKLNARYNLTIAAMMDALQDLLKSQKDPESSYEHGYIQAVKDAIRLTKEKVNEAQVPENS